MSNTKIYIGTSGWNYDHWFGVFYPDDLPKTKRFDYYSKKFNCVEVNATFYRNFKDSTYKKWYNQAPEKFKYVLKLPRFISHRKHLNEVSQDSVERFVNSANILEEKFGCGLLQVGPNTSVNENELSDLIDKLGEDFQLAVEFRNLDWYKEKTKEILKNKNIIFCDVDSPEIYFKQWVTSDKVYLRLHGKNEWYKYNYPNSELGKIASLIKDLAEKDLKEIYVFFNNDYNGYAPLNAIERKNMLNT